MGADKTNNIMTLSSGVSQPLLADVQYFELYSSSALNRKLKNIVLPGFYCGFEPVPGTGLSVRITSENSEGKGAASVDVNNVQISVQQIEDVTVSVKAGATNIIVLEANFEHGVKTTQVESASSVSAARIYARTDNTIGQNQIELCRVIVPNGATAVTKEMIVLKYRVNRAVGVEFSNEISSTEERKAATPLAVKTLHDLVDTKAPLDSPHLSGTPTSPTPEPGTNNTQIANAAFVKAAITALINGAPGTLDTLKEIAAAINNDPNFSTTINNVLALKAPLASPALTGIPTAPTAAQGTNNTQIATTAYVRAAISALVGSSPEALDTLNELAAALGNDPNFATTMTNALAGKQPKDATLTALAELATSADKLPYFTGADRAALTALTSVGRAILGKTSTQGVLDYLGLSNLLHTGDGRFLAGTFVSDAIDRTSIGARAATGCQFMRAHQAPDAPDQASYWQIITLSEVVSPTTVVDVLAVSGNNVLFGHGTGAGITSWRHVAMLEGAAFTGDISASNVRGSTSVTVGDGTGGLTKGGADGAGFDGNNLNIKSWNGIGFQCSSDDVIRAYISTRLGVIAAAENLQAGNAIFNKNGDVYGDIWGTGSGPGWLSAYIAGRPLRQYITMVGVYQNDKTKPFMLHDDGSGVFLATTDMLSGYVQSIRFGAVEHGNVYRSPGFADQLGYVITGVENGDSNDTPDRIQRRLLQLKVNGQWYTVGT